MFPAFICLFLSFALREWMAHTLKGSTLWAAQGACRDAMPGMVLAALVLWFDPQGLRRRTLAFVTAAWTVALLFLGASDGIYFAQCGARLDRTLIVNTSLTSLEPAINVWTVTAALLGAALLGVLGWSVWRLCHREQEGLGVRGKRWRLALAAGVAAAGLVPMAHSLTAQPETASSRRTHEMLVSGQAERIADIAVALWDTGPAWARPDAVPLSDGDRAWARQAGLESQGPLAAGPKPHWRRVVVVAVESLAQAFLDPGNSRRPAGMTPFMDSLERDYPHLENCYSAGTDTEQGQFSIACGRTDFEWGEHPYPGRTLFSLARERGYDTCMMYGDTMHFRDHEHCYPAALHVEHQFAKESFKGKRPAADFCSWGGALKDRAVFEEALDYLGKEPGRPVILLVDTIDTHPPYYWQKDTSEFPEAVAAQSSGLPKALNQLDDNLRFFLGELKRRGLFDQDTLVVLTADHFPAFAQEPLDLSGLDNHGTNRIPMVFITPRRDVFRGLDEKRMSSQLDLAPTLAAQMDFPAAGEFLGRNLLESGPGRALGRERELVRLRLEQGPEEDLLCDAKGFPQQQDSPLARWYRWRLGGL
jgi:hypothetical protein